MFLGHVIYLSCVAEDAFIAFRFAKNLASGHGLVWNPGEPPVEGYTDFLWVLLSAAAIRLGLSVIWFARIVGVAAACATLWLTYRTARRHLRVPPAVAMLPVWLLAACGPFATWASSGMEMTLFAFLALLSAYFVADAWQVDSRRGALWSAVALFAATLTRPEGMLLALLLLGVSGAVAAFAVRRKLPGFAAATALFLALFGVYFAWRYARYGYPLPNTFYAKTGGGTDQVLRGGLLAFLFYMQFVLPLVPIVLVAMWERGVPSARDLSRSIGLLMERHAFVFNAVIVIIVYTLYTIGIGGDYMAMHRFFVPVLPFIYLLAGAVAAVVHASIRSRQNAVGYGALVAFTIAATVFPSTPLERSFFHTPPQQHGNYRGVQTERWHVSRLSTIGRFFDGYRRDPAESLATNAIGAIGYYADMRILDMHGLVDAHIAHLPAPPDLGRSRPGHGREDLAYTFSLKPTYVMFSRDLTPSPIELWRYVPPELRAQVERDYAHTSVRLTDEGNHESGYFTFFERRDSLARRAAAVTSHVFKAKQEEESKGRKSGHHAAARHGRATRAGHRRHRPASHAGLGTVRLLSFHPAVPPILLFICRHDDWSSCMSRGLVRMPSSSEPWG